MEFMITMRLTNLMSPRFGPRELDLDIIGFSDNTTVNCSNYSHNDRLVIPHERAHLRDFVLRPLCDIPAGRKLRLGPDQANTAEKLLDSLNSSEPQKAFPLRNAVFSKKKRWPKKTHEADEDTLLMGILNVTPDSFSDGGKFNESVHNAVSHAIELCSQVYILLLIN